MDHPKTVRLPRRLPDRAHVYSDSPTEEDWLRRAIRCIERAGVKNRPTHRLHAAFSSSIARKSRGRPGYRLVDRDIDWAGWLPEHMRRVPLHELRERLAKIVDAWEPVE